MKKIWMLVLCLLLASCAVVKAPEESKEEVKEEILQVTMLGVGDNLIHNSIFDSRDKIDGKYNFDDLYAPVKDMIESVDIAYINQETICGGEELELSNYPCFNGPYEILDAVVKAGFDWISTSSNHTMDRGEQGILNEHAYLEKYKDINVTGSHPTQEHADTLQVIERNGVRVGILGYTYGLNGFALPEGKEYLVDLIDKDKISSDMEKIKEISDVQVVSMHWGEEYSLSESDEQKELAQFLSDLGADVIIGCHPHVIQPIDYVTSKDGQETLVIYSMGNFMSAQIDNINMLGLMPMFTLNFNTKTKEVTLSDVKAYPTITYIGGETIRYGWADVYATYTLKDYTNDLAATHYITLRRGQDVTREYFIGVLEEVMNDKVELVY